jgi:hypothetical protein
VSADQAAKAILRWDATWLPPGGFTASVTNLATRIGGDVLAQVAVEHGIAGPTHTSPLHAIRAHRVDLLEP